MRRALALVVALLLVLIPAHALAGPVIPPGQEDVVRRMLGNGPEAAAPWPNGCSVTSIAIQPQHIDAELACAERSLTIVLRHKSSTESAAFRSDKFAVAFVGSETVPPSLLEVVRARIGAAESSFRWMDPMAGPEAKRAGEPNGWRIFLLFLLAPPAVGALLGLVLRRAPRSRALVFLVVVALLPLLASTRQTTFNVYDLLWGSIAVALSALALLLPERFDRALLARALLAVFTAAISLVALELLARRAIANATYTPGEGVPRLRFQPWEREIGCEAIYPDAFSELYFARMRDLSRVPRVEGRARVVHVGDSMVDAGELPIADAFTGRLDAWHANEEHLNLGVSNTGTDAHFAILHRWLPRLRPDLVVLHVFPGNDIDEIDRPFVCSASGPLLDYANGPRLRFETPSFHVSAGILFGRGPSPFAVRFLAQRSAAARGVAAGMERLFRIGGGPSGPKQWEHFEALVEAVRARVEAEKMPLLVLVLPVRGDVEAAASSGGTGRSATTERILAALRARGIDTIDATPPLVESVRRDPARRWFRPARNNPHFDVDGHEAFARFIEPEIERRLHR